MKKIGMILLLSLTILPGFGRTNNQRASNQGIDESAVSQQQPAKMVSHQQEATSYFTVYTNVLYDAFLLPSLSVE